MHMLTHILDATGCHGPPVPLASAAHREHFARTVKLHRAVLACCMMLVRPMLQMFAPHIPVILHAMIKTMVSLDPMAMRSLLIKCLVGMTIFVGAVLRCEAYNRMRPLGPGCSGGGVGKAILAALMLGMVPDGGDGGRQGEDDNPGMIAAQGAIATLLAKGAIDRLCKALRLNLKE
jgi:hypothetical protein